MFHYFLAGADCGGSGSAGRLNGKGERFILLFQIAQFQPFQ